MFRPKSSRGIAYLLCWAESSPRRPDDVLYRRSLDVGQAVRCQPLSIDVAECGGARVWSMHGAYGRSYGEKLV
jgi:hypothetical protein